ITDVAHNPDAMEAVVRSLEELRVGRVALVFGVSQDKDFLRMVGLLKSIVDRAIVVSAETERARPAQDLLRAFVEHGVPAEAETNVKTGVQRAMNFAESKQPILVTGSHFVVGEALAFLQKKKYLTISQ
ncbi:MAG: hypothetical protein MN733_40770, partial [Nitrososphaera sp.]|nr:hypothetical protein [Nitrososphaera sp.]